LKNEEYRKQEIKNPLNIFKIIYTLKLFSRLFANFEIVNQRREGFARDGIFIGSLDKALFQFKTVNFIEPVGKRCIGAYGCPFISSRANNIYESIHKTPAHPPATIFTRRCE
jgi:hypothetical protein